MEEGVHSRVTLKEATPSGPPTGTPGLIAQPLRHHICGWFVHLGPVPPNVTGHELCLQDRAPRDLADYPSGVHLKRPRVSLPDPSVGE
jgi:hypothetical protein